MLRIIAGVIVGWIVMAIIVLASFGIAWLALGTKGTVQPDSYWTTNTFNICVLAGGTLAAIAGGLVCALIARSNKAAFALAVIVLLMGVGSAITQMSRPDPPARTGEITMEAMQTHGKEPTWFAISKAFTGTLGVLIGASLVKKRASAAAP
jgi:peptidoglycan/LPS O-acetylase OafA/YrhL